MVNKVIYIGRLGKKPVMNTTQKNTEVVNFELAVEDTWKDGDKNLQRNTEWIPCVAWGKLARTICDYLDTGDMIYIEGRSKVRKWRNEKTNTNYEKTEAHLKYMKILVAKGKVQVEDLPPLPNGDDVPF